MQESDYSCMQLTSLFQKADIYMHVYYTNIKSDSYFKFGVAADLVGMGLIRSGCDLQFSMRYACNYTTIPPY